MLLFGWTGAWCGGVLSPVPSFAQERSGEREDALHRLHVDVAYLSSDLLEGRETGSRGATLAADYIARRFEALGLAPAGDGAWFQSFSVRSSTHPHAPASEGAPRPARNVVGRLDTGADRTVVIGAHYDHLGYGGFGSRQPSDSLIHNGADDNASGVAALFDIARQLQRADAPSSNVLFVAFSGEEMGLHGSKHFVDAPPLPLREINYMINLDMVGRLNDDRELAVSGVGTSPAWGAAVDAAATATGLTVKTHDSGLGPSDHASFYLADIPAVHLFTGQHADYHTPTDDSHRINYDGLHDVATFVVRVVDALADDGALAFTKTKDESRRRPAAFTVTLGVMPDYVYDGDGMRIDAVLDEGPAVEAGLKDGDIVIRLGQTDVTDIYAYMEALSQFEEGDVAPVTVRRGDEVIDTQVQF